MADSAISDLVRSGALAPDTLMELARDPFGSGDSISGALAELGLYFKNPGADWRDPVQIATTANITLSGEQTIDGVLTSGTDVLVKDQTAADENGAYVSASGAWTRRTDFDADAEVDPGAVFFVREGTANGGKAFFVSSVDPHVVDTDDIDFSELVSNNQPIKTVLPLSGAGVIYNIPPECTRVEFFTDTDIIMAGNAGAHIQIRNGGTANNGSGVSQVDATGTASATAFQRVGGAVNTTSVSTGPKLFAKSYVWNPRSASLPTQVEIHGHCKGEPASYHTRMECDTTQDDDEIYFEGNGANFSSGSVTLIAYFD